MKIPKKFFPVVFAFFLTLIMVFIVTGVGTAVNVGFPPNFFALWMKAWGVHDTTGGLMRRAQNITMFEVRGLDDARKRLVAKKRTAQETGAVLWPNHDMAFWRSRKPFPGFYD